MGRQREERCKEERVYSFTGGDNSAILFTAGGSTVKTQELPGSLHLDLLLLLLDSRHLGHLVQS